MAAEEPSADDLAEYKADDEVRLHFAVCARVCDACLSTGRARTQSRLRHNNNNNNNDDDDEAGGYDGESTNNQSSYKVRTLLRCGPAVDSIVTPPHRRCRTAQCACQLIQGLSTELPRSAVLTPALVRGERVASPSTVVSSLFCLFLSQPGLSLPSPSSAFSVRAYFDGTPRQRRAALGALAVRSFCRRQSNARRSSGFSDDVALAPPLRCWPKAAANRFAQR